MAKRMAARRPTVMLKRPKKVEPKVDASGHAIRTCVVCGAPHDGGYLWDLHWVQGKRDLVDTCSPACRVKGGFKERKVTGSVA